MLNTLKSKLIASYQRYAAYGPAAFFLGGVVFDILTLGRIDNLFNILQQGFYLGVIGLFLTAEIVRQVAGVQFSKWIERYWHYREFVVHFFFGSLLSCYTIFYFKSSSLWQSFLFFALLALVLVVNELERFQRRGVLLRVVLFSLCLTSYLIYLVPIVYGAVGLVPFLIAWTLSILIIIWVYRHWLRRLANVAQNSEQGIWSRRVRRSLLPVALVQLLFLAFYLFGIIPPVPLALNFAGIYHNVQKSQGHYQLSHLKPWWRFWHHGDQRFEASPGDKIFFYARIFSPGRFNDKIFLHWWVKTPGNRSRWITADRIPLTVTGGREEGFRAYAYKSNYQPGDYRVTVESSDGREIGRLYFRVVASDQDPTTRVFKIESD